MKLCLLPLLRWKNSYLGVCLFINFKTVFCVSTVLASSWGADEAVNALRWSHQK